MNAVLERLHELGLVVTDPGLPLGPEPTIDDVRAYATRAVLASTVGQAIGPTIDAAARQLDTMAKRTGKDAPRIELAANLGGTVITYKVDGRLKRQQISGDANSPVQFLDELAPVLDQIGWPWRFVRVEVTRPYRVDRVLLVPTAIVPALVDLLAIHGGAPGVPAAPGAQRWVAPSTLGTATAAPAHAVAPQRTIAEIVGDDHVYVSDAESVDAAADYITLIEDLAKRILPVAVVNVTCDEELNGRLLKLTLDRRRFAARLRGGDMVDVPPIVACLNEALAAAAVTGRVYEVSEAGWRQEFGIAFATDEQAAELVASGLTVITRPTMKL